MSVLVREMVESDAGAVVAMVRGLALHVGSEAVPKLSSDTLLQSLDLIDVVVAEDKNRLLGACLGLMTFSTWRGARGLYIVDLFVEEQARGRNIGLLLLKESARRAVARGAGFIKLEVDQGNHGAEQFYARLGFAKKTEDMLHVLEQNQLMTFIATGDIT